jgi:hypothetical protein
MRAGASPKMDPSCGIRGDRIVEGLGGMWRCGHSHRLTNGGGAQPVS